MMTASQNAILPLVIFSGGSSDEQACEPSGAIRHGLPACFVCDGHGRIQTWGADSERLVGVSAAEALRRLVGELFVPTDREPSFVEGADGAASAAVVRLCLDGHPTLTFLQRSLPLPAAAPTGTFAVLLWPTPRTPPLGMLPESVAAIATRIGHDLWQMLSPVLGNALLLEEESNSDVLRFRLGCIREATEATRAFAQRLMALDPKRKPTLESRDLGRVVREALPAVRANLRNRIVLHESIADVDGVRANHKQIEQLLVQLVTNAQDAMSGSGEIAIRVDAVESAGERLPPGSWARLQVRDTGPGMEPSLLAHAFEPFVSTKVPASGAGLGLPIVVATLHQHGGVFEVDSRPGGGTVVSLYFPRRPDEPAAPARSSIAEAPASAASPTASILLVEDNPMVRRSVEGSLRSMGYVVTAVGNGEQCLAALRKDPTSKLDLLITDVVMPEMSGKQLIDRVRQLRPSLPVLFMSGYDLSTLAGRRQAVTAEHFLQKPFDSQDLAQAVLAAIAASKHTE
jgi:two-component system cell cycle sensor histidine kinase/response regulator CckA